jgi:hypothetical protein
MEQHSPRITCSFASIRWVFLSAVDFDQLEIWTAATEFEPEPESTSHGVPDESFDLNTENAGLNRENEYLQHALATVQSADAERAVLMHKYQCYFLLGNLIDAIRNECVVGGRNHWAGEDRRSKLIFIYLDQRTVYGFWTSLFSGLGPMLYHFVTANEDEHDKAGSVYNIVPC